MNKEKLLSELKKELAARKVVISQNQAAVSQLEHEINMAENISNNTWEIWESLHSFNPHGHFSLLEFLQQLIAIDKKLKKIQFDGKLNQLEGE